VDGVILSGGNDYDPGVYGCASTPSVRRVHPRREAFDLHLGRVVLEKGMPVLGICCGAQLLSIARGGALHVDIGDDFPDGLDHRERAGRAVHHEVAFEEGSRFAEIFGQTRIRVNSKHHQAIRTAGEGLRITGRAPDGVPEAVEGEDGFILGVQWHPELMPGDPNQERLFRALIDGVTGGGRR
jgi:putative glutamine amidotransferase